MIEIDQVTKSYGDRRVVDSLSLTVGAGELPSARGSSQRSVVLAGGVLVQL